MTGAFCLLGCSLDPDEREHVINFKIKQAKLGYPGLLFKEPYDAIVHYLNETRLERYFKLMGKVPVEPWLLPAPELKYISLLTVENIVTFIDLNGCFEYAQTVYERLKNSVDVENPLIALIGVDHSLTGGVLRFLSEIYGRDSLGLIVLDSHFDAILPSIRCGLIQYDIETNPNTPFDPLDPFIKNRLDSYNADSFLYYLIERGWIKAENVVVLGVSDYPPPSAFEIDDHRVERYIKHYVGLENKGVKIIKKDDVEENPSLVKNVLQSLDVDNIYISIDIDVGANNAILGARFLDYDGLSETNIYNVVTEVSKQLKHSFQLVGFDIMETDVFRASMDNTYQIEINIIKKLLG